MNRAELVEEIIEKYRQNGFDNDLQRRVKRHADLIRAFDPDIAVGLDNFCDKTHWVKRCGSLREPPNTCISNAAQALAARYRAQLWFIAVRPLNGKLVLHVTTNCEFAEHRPVLGYLVEIVLDTSG